MKLPRSKLRGISRSGFVPDVVTGCYSQSLQAAGYLNENEKIYTLVIENQDFGDNWPWCLTIRMSETGCISIKHCAGV